MATSPTLSVSESVNKMSRESVSQPSFPEGPCIQLLVTISLSRVSDVSATGGGTGNCEVIRDVA